MNGKPYSLNWARSVVEEHHRVLRRATEIVDPLLGVSTTELTRLVVKRPDSWKKYKRMVKLADRLLGRVPPEIPKDYTDVWVGHNVWAMWAQMDHKGSKRVLTDPMARSILKEPFMKGGTEGAAGDRGTPPLPGQKEIDWA
jgi:hypothetical protein